MGSLRLTFATLGVLAMTVAAALTLAALDAWIGDFGALLWICACFFFPFITGIALGPRASGAGGRVAGALMGGLFVLAPAFAIPSIEAGIAGVQTPAPDPLLFLGIFVPLGMAQGAIAMPVGAGARRRRRAA